MKYTSAEDDEEGRSMTKKRIAILVILGLFSLLPLAALVLGIMYNTACPVQPWIPRWLLISGATGVGIFAFSFFTVGHSVARSIEPCGLFRI